jgi:hypothetical protein
MVVAVGVPKGGGGAELPPEPIGTCTMALHCGQEARFPAADAATLSVRPQLVQGNSI